MKNLNIMKAIDDFLFHNYLQVNIDIRSKMQNSELEQLYSFTKIINLLIDE